MLNQQIKDITIHDKRIGTQSPCFIIAEAGVNHNGNLNTALELVRKAKEIGADCVKFQTFKAESVITKNAPKAEYQLKVTNPEESQFQMLKNLELGFEDYVKIIDECKKWDIMFLSTPYNEEDSDFLNNLGVSAFKIASGQLVELSFLEHVAHYGKPIILSTGMATLSEAYDAVQVIKNAGNDQIILLQCTTNYPSDNKDANIRAMVTMGNALGVLYGYSDHIEENYACYAAVSLGATVIEKHFTLDRELPGPDHSASLNVEQFETLIKGIRKTEEALGSPVKTPSEKERRNTIGMRRSIVLKKPLNKGEEFTMDNLTYKRPATGLEPRRINEIIGKKAAMDIKSDIPLKEAMIIWE
ncbi:N-acetylneuraminate synthase [Flagellimonas sp.]|uniref:N-acetylneuraminate synthase n=1 Tax=Flagellimonas sp. TaxID=2058762 RepID=UPI003BA957B6